MNCPVDNTALVMSERQGIESDYCPQCRGVWLDRGELDKIIERSVPMVSGRPIDNVAPPGEQEYRHDGYYDKRQGKHKREGFLGELFN